MKMSKKAMQELAKCIDNAKRTATGHYSGYELVAQAEIINWLQESITIELLKDHTFETVENFTENCSEMENEVSK